jgi:hypothetical protein
MTASSEGRRLSLTDRQAPTLGRVLEILESAPKI